jgi:transposase-like protein
MRQCAKVYFQSNGDTEWAKKKYSKELKAQIALDAIKGQKTIAELASEYGVHYIVVVHLIGRYC